jgi:hypothetical protein
VNTGNKPGNGSKWKSRLLLAAFIAFILWMIAAGEKYDDGICRYGGNGAEWGC